MIRLARIELLKIRTTRTPIALLGAAVVITALITTLDAARAGGKFTPPLSTAAGLSFVVTITGFALLMAFALGVIVSSGEFAHGTATATYLGCPQRGRVLAAKTIASFVVGMLFGAVGAATSLAIGLAFTAAKGDAVSIGAATLTRFGVGAVLGGALLAALGASIGSLVRSQLAGVVGVVVWCLLLESILGGIFSSLGPYLPFTAATSLGGSKPGGGDIGFYSSGTVHPLPFAGVAVLMAGLVVFVSVLANRTTVAHDIG
jgi:ABC-2 type transport system permease protein